MDDYSAPSGQFWLLLGIVAGFGCVTFLAWAILDLFRSAIRMHRTMQQEVIVQDTTSAYFKTCMPLARHIGQALKMAFAPENGPVGWYTKIHRKLTSQLSSAGYPQGLNTDEYIGFLVLSAFEGGVAGVAFFLVAPEYGIDLCFFLGAILGVMLQRTWLKRKRIQRQLAICKQLPFAMDLLCLSTEAGLDFTGALNGICQKLGTSALGEEFSIMLREIQLGKTRGEAMRDLTQRVDVNEIRSVMSSLLQADELGTPIGPVLRIQAAQQRDRRGQRAEELANKAPVKIIFPLLLFVAAAALLVIGPVVIEFL